MPLKSPYTPQQQCVHAFAIERAKVALGPGPHRPQSIGIRAHVVSDYAFNWLAEHGELPTGVHTAKATRQLDWSSGPYPTLEVDFTPLHRLCSDAGKDQPPLPVEDLGSGSPVTP